MAHYHPATADRGKGIAGAALVTLAVGWLLVSGLGVQLPQAAQQALLLVDVRPEMPPKPKQPPPERRRSGRPEGEASPPNLRAEPTEIVAPHVATPVPPPPVIVAPIAGVGAAPSAGNAEVPGPGFGAGGTGNGRGAGGDGDGDGAGGGTPPRHIRGRLKDSDYPRAAAEAGARGTVGVRYLVTPQGRVGECHVDSSSGNAELDATTCRLIIERYRYKPCLDEDRQPVPCYIVERHSWEIENDPEPER